MNTGKQNVMGCGLAITNVYSQKGGRIANVSRIEVLNDCKVLSQTYRNHIKDSSSETELTLKSTLRED